MFLLLLTMMLSSGAFLALNALLVVPAAVWYGIAVFYFLIGFIGRICYQKAGFSWKTIVADAIMGVALLLAACAMLATAASVLALLEGVVVVSVFQIGALVVLIKQDTWASRQVRAVEWLNTFIPAITSLITLGLMLRFVVLGSLLMQIQIHAWGWIVASCLISMIVFGLSMLQFYHTIVISSGALLHPAPVIPNPATIALPVPQSIEEKEEVLKQSIDQFCNLETEEKEKKLILIQLKEEKCAEQGIAFTFLRIIYRFCYLEESVSPDQLIDSQKQVIQPAYRNRFAQYCAQVFLRPDVGQEVQFVIHCLLKNPEWCSTTHVLELLQVVDAFLKTNKSDRESFPSDSLFERTLDSVFKTINENEEPLSSESLPQGRQNQEKFLNRIVKLKLEKPWQREEHSLLKNQCLSVFLYRTEFCGNLLFPLDFFLKLERVTQEFCRLDAAEKEVCMYQWQQEDLNGEHNFSDNHKKILRVVFSQDHPHRTSEEVKASFSEILRQVNTGYLSHWKIDPSEVESYRTSIEIMMNDPRFYGHDDLSSNEVVLPVQSLSC